MLSDLSVLDERTLPDHLPPALVETIDAFGLDIWLYSAADWCVRSCQAPRVDREASTVQFEPTVVPTFDKVLSGIVKMVGVSDDHARVAACESALQQEFGTQVSAARSQPYYLDVTHPAANKGTVVERLSRYLKIPMEQIATIGDRANDVLMFARSGLNIAMGNASEEVQRQAMCVTTSFADEGFANAVEQYVPPHAEPARGAAVKATGQLHRVGQSIWLDNITRAADLFRPIYDRTNGVDGWVSLEVSPLLAYDSAGTIAAAKDLFARADRPNLMIKIPGTREGLPTIEEAIFAGVPVNMTLLFSALTQQLQKDAAGSFVKSWSELIRVITSKGDALNKKGQV